MCFATKWKAPTPLRRLTNPYTGSAFFSLSDEQGAEPGVSKLARAADSKLCSARIKEGYALALTNSIRSQTNAFALISEDGSPPKISTLFLHPLARALRNLCVLDLLQLKPC